MLYSYGFQRSVIHMNAIIINFVCFVYYFFLVFCFVFCNARYTIYIHTYHIWNTLLLQRRLGTREKNAPFIRRQILSFVPSSVCVFCLFWLRLFWGPARLQIANVQFVRIECGPHGAPADIYHIDGARDLDHMHGKQWQLNAGSYHLYCAVMVIYKSYGLTSLIARTIRNFHLQFEAVQWLTGATTSAAQCDSDRKKSIKKQNEKKTQNVLVYQLRGLRRFCRSRPIDGFGRSSKSAIRIMRIWIIELVTYQLANALQSNAQIEVCLQFAFCCLLFRNAQHSTSWMAQCTRKLMWLAVLCLRKSATDRRQPVR